MNLLRYILFVLLTVVSLFSTLCHNCSLKSWPIELLILLCLLGYLFVLNRKKERRIVWWNVILAPILGLALGFIYVAWLHSDSFPSNFLTGYDRDTDFQYQSELNILTGEANQTIHTTDMAAPFRRVI